MVNIIFRSTRGRERRVLRSRHVTEREEEARRLSSNFAKKKDKQRMEGNCF